MNLFYFGTLCVDFTALSVNGFEVCKVHLGFSLYVKESLVFPLYAKCIR